ncbi:thioredoxin domain-containing protein [Candidatus Spongiihabitans sp.]|uniref:thioredoxin domain-containing protein n=1 Tax=Candidatus Spongiihabitans sp. TaxID=3101308 RepID=UPI003C7BAFB4
MPNQLIHQTSPYLLQHANNPVDWHAWTEPALAAARAQNKPILLSIGYAACHWCHVMERESFENDAIAEIMNKHFVCIKVDREERPDLDKIYQIAHQMLTQRPGGWPLTIALTPDGHAPFFAGTYFPAEPRYNMPGFGELLEKISAHFHENSEKLAGYHVSFNQALEKLNPQSSASRIPDPLTALARATSALAKQYDREFGGFGDAPKFPHPTQLELLLVVARYPNLAKQTQSAVAASKTAAQMARNTLTHMAQGGLFDHLGGGFFRYSVDRKWQIPHFEKMLYDNAQLLNLYCDGYRLFGDAQYADAAMATAQWVAVDMQQPDGGYASTLDADSEGEEGKYYVWSETDLRAILAQDEYALLENYFGLYGEANFEGSWHFNMNPEMSPETDLESSARHAEKTLHAAKSKLLKIRDARIRPGLDDKILSAWNGLMIKGMAKAGRVLAQPEFIQSAQIAADFVRENMWQDAKADRSQAGRMLAAYSQGKAHLNGYLDDYAFMLDGLIELLESSWRSADLEFATAICDAMLARFEDRENGGFFFTSHDHEKLLCRQKYGADDAIPSGNGAAILGLLKLGNLLGEPKYLRSAEAALSLFADDLERHPSVNGLMTIALQHLGDQHATVIIRGGDASDQSTSVEQWMQFCYDQYQPLTHIFAIEKDAKNLPPTLALRKAGKTTTAYICRGSHCTPPITSLRALQKQFGAT